MAPWRRRRQPPAQLYSTAGLNGDSGIVGGLAVLVGNLAANNGLDGISASRFSGAAHNVIGSHPDNDLNATPTAGNVCDGAPARDAGLRLPAVRP